MSRIYRSLMWTGVVAVGITACGDDVTITQPEPQIRSVVVAPDGAELQVGSSLQFTAAVTADPGIGTITIAWSSSNTAAATINPTSGEASGVAPGSTAIKATATAGTSTAEGAATLTVVGAPAPPGPPTVSISTITAGGLPVNIAAVMGQIEVGVNLERNGNTMDRLELLLGTKVVATQSFSTAPPAQASAGGPELVPELIVFSINTAAFDLITGVPDHLNGPVTLSVRAFIAGQTSGPAANNSVQITLANVNTWTGTMDFTGTTAQATSPVNGLGYNRGGLSFTVLPVIYTPGVTMASGNVSFGSAACDANGTGTRTTALTAPAAGSSAWTGALNNTSAAGATNVNRYEFNNLAGCTALVGLTGEVPVLNAIGSNGQPLVTGGVAASIVGIRLDNRPPGAPTFMANPNLRQNGWINGTVGLTGLNTSATDNDWLVNGAADAGVGGYSRIMRTAAATGGLVNDARAAAGSDSPALPAPSLNNNDYCAVISAQDALGNESALPAAGTACTAPPVASSTAVLAQHLRFGVDIAPPTIAFMGGLAVNDSLNGGSVGGEFQVTVTDTGTVGNSGMLSGSAVRGTVQIRSAALTPPSAASCFIGNFANGVCNPVSVNAAPPFPLVPTTTVAAAVTVGYYTYDAFSQDAAGNQSGTVNRVIAYDPAANVPALTTALFNVPLTGPTAVFNANSSDNFDLRWVQYSLTYAGGFAGPIIHPITTLNTFNTPPLVNSNVAAGITINGFIRQIEDVTGNSPLTVSGQFKPTNLAGQAKDQANNLSAVANTAIPAASVTTGVSYTAAAAAQLIRSWAITAPAAAVNISNGAGPAAPVNPLSVTIDVDAFGPTATFSSPFTRVDFYQVVGGNLVQIGSTTSFSTVDDGSPFGRRHRFSFSWTPGPSVAPGVQTIFAVGVNGVGDGLVTLANGNITVTNP